MRCLQMSPVMISTSCVISHVEIMSFTHRKGVSMATVPFAGFGVVLQRGVSVDSREVISKLDSPRFNEYLARWLATGENFLMYAIADSGLHFTFETSLRGRIAERVEMVFSEFSARKQVCAFDFHTDAAFKQLLTVKAEQHMAQALDSKPTTTAAAADIKITRAESPLYGSVLFATIPRQVIQRRDLASFLLALDSLVSDLDAIQANWMQLRLNFEGWEGDTRHLHEIPAIKAFMLGAMGAAPWWLALVHPSEYIKWFGMLVESIQVRSRSGRVSLKFKPNGLRMVSGMPILEATHMLDSSAIEQGDSRDDMVADLRIAIQQLENGVDLIKADPLAVMAKKSA